MNLSDLEKIGKVSPSKDFRTQAKNRLMQRIRTENASWLENLLYEFQKIQVNPHFRLTAKERLNYQINHPQFLPNWFFTLFRQKKLVSFLTAFSLLFISLFGFSIFNTETVEANNTVRLVVLKGDPLLKRLGSNWIPAQNLLEMHIGDQVFTDANDVAEIHFFDNSVTRLDTNTQITITSFYKKPSQEQIELELNQGRTWNKVIQSIAQKSNFSVKTHNSLVSAQNATFDVSASSDQPTEINVVDHLIDVKILQNNASSVVARTKVTEGNKVEIQVSDQKTIVQTAQITPIEDSQIDEIWFQENLEKDQTHLENLQKKTTDKIIAEAGILPDSPFYSVKKTFKEAKNAISKKDETSKNITDLRQKIQEASALASKNETESSQAILTEIKQTLDLKTSSIEFKQILQDEVVTLQNDYVTVLPDSNLYFIKAFLRDLKVEIENNSSEVLSQKLNEKLFEAQDLIDKGQIELVQEILQEIQAEQAPAHGTGTLVASLDDIEKNSVLIQKSEELQIIQSLKDKLETESTEGHSDVLPLLTEIHQNTITAITLLSPPEPELKPLNKPILVQTPPTPILLPTPKNNDAKSKAEEFISKINLYKSERGYLNALTIRLNRIPNNSSQLPLLIEIKKSLPANEQYLVTQKILFITNQAKK